mmetsp:Transcript_126368/g.246406  ORF Transcript_126368/g.246406 Transcript_126368/m.246406 type:complete len:104 (-) Transcript_126368:52-363(-)
MSNAAHKKAAPMATSLAKPRKDCPNSDVHFLFLVQRRLYCLSARVMAIRYGSSASVSKRPTLDRPVASNRRGTIEAVLKRFTDNPSFLRRFTCEPCFAAQYHA